MFESMEKKLRETDTKVLAASFLGITGAAVLAYYLYHKKDTS